MKMFMSFAAALLMAGPVAAQSSSHEAHHPAVKPPATAMSDEKACPKMDEMSGNMEQMMQMHQQMMSQMAEMKQMMQMMQQHQGMGMAMPKSAPPTDDKPH